MDTSTSTDTDTFTDIVHYPSCSLTGAINQKARDIEQNSGSEHFTFHRKTRHTTE